ncbi:hypothetical protein KBTX_03910 [wastewater metagenome]|uniref:DUF4139 domain-containing protein n=2 Tax=unclassified sequences TaxID=12908 RepID=A0A5B8RIM8_9ZZZZ|nr:hypothetical protein KBTEX_03910 [uncultured organism]
MRWQQFPAVAVLALAGGTAAMAATPDTRHLVLYQNAAAFVSASVALPAGGGPLPLEGLPDGMRFETLSVTDDDGAVQTVRRPAPAGSTLARWRGREVVLLHDGQRRRGRLLAVENGTPVVSVDGRLEWIDAASPWRVALPTDTLPQATAATVMPADGASGALALDYLTEGLNWQADYTLRLAPAGARLSGSATLQNTSGADFDGATVTLIGGQVNDPGNGGPRPMKLEARAMSADSATAPAPQAAGDWYRYRLPGTHSLGDGERLRVPLLNAVPVDVERRYRVSGQAMRQGGDEPPVTVTTEVTPRGRNDVPLPAGTVRVIDATGDAPLYQGGDRIDHIPPGEAFELSLGTAFDLSAERERTAYRRIGDDTHEIAWRVTVSNAGRDNRTVEVVEHMAGDWELLEASPASKEQDADTARWRLSVPAGDETTLTYRVRVRQ